MKSLYKYIKGKSTAYIVYKKLEKIQRDSLFVLYYYISKKLFCQEILNLTLYLLNISQIYDKMYTNKRTLINNIKKGVN